MSDASRSPSPNHMPGFPAVNTKGMNIIRNLSDDEEIPLRNQGRVDDQGIEEESKHEDGDHRMIQQNPKKRGRHELESQS